MNGCDILLIETMAVMCLIERMVDIDTDIDRKNSDMLIQKNCCDILDRKNGCDVLDRKNG